MMKKILNFLVWSIVLTIVVNLFAVLNIFAAEPLTANVVHNIGNKNLTVTFSEAIETTDFSDASFFEVNGAQSIALWAYSISESEVKFSYQDELKQSSEYVLILPEGIKTDSGVVLTKRYYWFTTDDGYDSVQTLRTCDYSSGASIYTDIESYSPSTNGPNYFEDGDHGAAWGIKLKESADEYNIPLRGFTALSDDLTSLSFSMKPLEDLKLDISFMTYNDKTPVNIGFYNNYGIRVGRAWQFASNTDKLSDYTAGNWYKVKLVYDKTKNEMWIYINGNMMKKLDSEYLADYTGINSIRFMVPKDECTSARTVLVIDDIKTEKVTKGMTVSQVRFNDAENKSTGGLALAGNSLKNATVTFNRAAKSESLTSDSVKLLYDDNPIEYTGALSDDGKTYTLTPKNTDLTYNKVSIDVSGVKDENGLECADYTTFSVSNNYKGNLTASLMSVDEELHRVKVRFSEHVANSALKNTVLISSRIGEAQPLTVENNKGLDVTFTYKNTLDGSAEYALEFGKDTKSIFGSMISDRWLHFSTNKTNYFNSRESGTWSNYEDNAARIYTNFYGAVDIDNINSANCNRSKNITDTGDEGYGKAWKVDVVTDATNSSGTWLGNNNLWWKGFKAPESDVSAIRFSIKPVKWQNTLIELYDKSGKQFGIALRPFYNGLGALRYGKTLYAGSANDGLLHLEGDKQLWKYKANEWIDFKIIRNKTSNTMDVYVNEELSTQLDNSYLDGYAGFGNKTETAGDWFIRIMTQPGQIAGNLGETLLYMDNIYSYSISETSGIVEAKYYGDNDVYNSFEATKEDIKSISVKFSDAIDESSVTSETVKIIAGDSGENIEWSQTAYDENENKLTLTLNKPLPAKLKSNITISGVLSKDKTKTFSDYKAYIGEDVDEFASISIVNNEGKEITEFVAGETYYAKFSAYNNTDSVKNITLIVAQYGDVLENVAPHPITINSKSLFTLGRDSEDKITITPMSNTKHIKVFAWNDTAQVKPLCKAASATVKK